MRTCLQVAPRASNNCLLVDAWRCTMPQLHVTPNNELETHLSVLRATSIMHECNPRPGEKSCSGRV